MIYISTSPLAPASAHRAYQTTIEGAYIKPKSPAPPHHISYYMNNALKILVRKNVRLKQNMQLEK